MLIISGCKNKSKTEVSNEPDPNLRSFHFLVERSKVYSLLQLVFSKDDLIYKKYINIAIQYSYNSIFYICIEI